MKRKLPQDLPQSQKLPLSKSLLERILARQLYESMIRATAESLPSSRRGKAANEVPQAGIRTAAEIQKDLTEFFNTRPHPWRSHLQRRRVRAARVRAQARAVALNKRKVA